MTLALLPGGRLVCTEPVGVLGVRKGALMLLPLLRCESICGLIRAPSMLANQPTVCPGGANSPFSVGSVSSKMDGLGAGAGNELGRGDITRVDGDSRTRGGVVIVSLAESADDGVDWPNPRFGQNSPASPARINRPRTR